MTTKSWAWRLAATALAAALIPACKSAGVADTLFLFTFAGAYPGTFWNQAAPTGSATAVKDVTHGVGTVPPLESLVITASSSPSAITTETTVSFNPAAVTFSVSMAADTASGPDGIGTFIIRDFVNANVASISWNETTNILTLTILATNTVIATPTANLNFHKFTFSRTAGGNASWTMDNGGPLLTGTSFPPGPWTIELGGSFPTGTTQASFYFDNVTVTTP